MSEKVHVTVDLTSMTMQDSVYVSVLCICTQLISSALDAIHQIACFLAVVNSKDFNTTAYFKTMELNAFIFVIALIQAAK